MINLASFIIVLSALTATIVIVFHKWRIIEKLQERGVNYCEFCFGFWLSLAITLIFSIFGIVELNLINLLAPFGAASITRQLLR